MKKYIFIFIVLFCLPCFCSAEKVIEFTPVNDYGYSETYTAYEAWSMKTCMWYALTCIKP